jgi:hypothetical protein
MIRWMPIGAGVLILAHFLFLQPAVAQGGDVAEAMGGIDLTGKVVFERLIEKSYPVSGEGAQLFVSNKFGTVQVSTWDNPVIQVRATIKVGAESLVQAERYAQTIAVEGNHIDNHVEVRTVFPEGKPDTSIGGYTVELQIITPSNIALGIENRFGDCYVSDIMGNVSLDIGYGAIGLTNIGGVARVRAKGDFPLQVSGLSAGGTFLLRSSQAAFSRVGGDLTINNYLGTVTLEKLDPTAQVAVVCDNGPVHLTLPEGAKPFLMATAEFGQIESDVPLKSQTWGRTNTGQIGEETAAQRIEIKSSFDSVFVHLQSLVPLVEHSETQETESVQETIKRSIPISTGKSLLLDAIEGDVTVEGVDGLSQVEIELIRFVRIENVKNAKLALEGLQWDYEDTGNELRIRTLLEEDLTAIGVTESRIDVYIRYPNKTPLKIVHTSDLTKVTGSASSLVVEQKEGIVHIIESAGETEITNRLGDILIEKNSGKIRATTDQGSIRANRTKGDIRLESRRGKLVVDSPQGKVYARNTGGDIRVIALEGVHGELDVMAVDGNISMVMPPISDVWIVLNVVDGNVYSTFPVTGSHEKNTHTFQGRLNAATHRVVLETHRGNVVLD